jgi:hypothetical protein
VLSFRSGRSNGSSKIGKKEKCGGGGASRRAGSGRGSGVWGASSEVLLEKQWVFESEEM